MYHVVRLGIYNSRKFGLWKMLQLTAVQYACFSPFTFFDKMRPVYLMIHYGVLSFISNIIEVILTFYATVVCIFKVCDNQKLVY